MRTHCKSMCPWLQTLSLMTSFRAELSLMLVVWWLKRKCLCPCCLWKILLLGLKLLLLRNRPSITVNNKTKHNTPQVSVGYSLHSSNLCHDKSLYDDLGMRTGCISFWKVLPANWPACSDEELAKKNNVLSQPLAAHLDTECIWC